MDRQGPGYPDTVNSVPKRPRPPTGVVLAAGAGTRLGRGPKALLPRGGVPLVTLLVGELRAGGCADVVVVLGAGADRVRDAADLGGARVVVNREWARGMGGSFAAGVAAAGRADALVALVDQPAVDRGLVARLIAAHVPGRVTAAAYADGAGGRRRGHPVLFAADLARAAAALAEGDAGARAWIARNPGLVDLVDCSDLADGGDVDTAADLRLLAGGGAPGRGTG